MSRLSRTMVILFFPFHAFVYITSTDPDQLMPDEVLHHLDTMKLTMY